MLASLSFRRSRPGGLAVSSRIEVCPPSGTDGRDRPWTRLQSWLLGDVATTTDEDAERLAAVRLDFATSIEDVDPLRAGGVLMRINTARSLRELWHLRTAVYGVISIEHSQSEAEARLARLNRHFPTRAPRSAFAPL